MRIAQKFHLNFRAKCVIYYADLLTIVNALWAPIFTLTKEMQPIMKQPHTNLDLATQTDTRSRLADRLGFLLAKRWLRIHRESEAVRVKKAFPADGSKQNQSKQ